MCAVLCSEVHSAPPTAPPSQRIESTISTKYCRGTMAAHCHAKALMQQYRCLAPNHTRRAPVVVRAQAQRTATLAGSKVGLPAWPTGVTASQRQLLLSWNPYANGKRLQHRDAPPACPANACACKAYMFSHWHSEQHNQVVSLRECNAHLLRVCRWLFRKPVHTVYWVQCASATRTRMMSRCVCYAANMLLSNL